MSERLDTIRDEVRDDMGSPPTSVITDAQITRRVNQAYREIATRYRHPELVSTETINTVDGTVTYSPASDYWYTLALRDEDNDRVMKWRPLEWLLAQDVDSKGQPQFWSRQGASLRFYPTPDGAYSLTHYYVARITELSLDADTTVFDDAAWDEIIKWGAVFRSFHMIGEHDRSIHARNIWRTLVTSMPETDALNKESGEYIIAPLNDNPVPGHRAGTTE